MINAKLYISYSSWWQVIFFRFRNRYDISIPSSWRELPARKVLPVMKAMLEGHPTRRLCLQVLRALLPLPASVFYRIKSIDFLERLIPHIEWISHTPMTDTPLRAISFNGVVYAMPAEDFQNLRLQEYKEADKYYQQILKGDNDALPRLMAVLLRELEEDPAQRLKNNDLRQPFYLADLEARAKTFNRLPAEVGFYVVQYFTACKVSLYEHYPAAFEGGKNTEHSEASWNDALTDVAENGTFGNFQEVLQLRVHIFYEWIAKNKRRIKEQELKDLQEAIKRNHNKIASA